MDTDKSSNDWDFTFKPRDIMKSTSKSTEMQSALRTLKRKHSIGSSMSSNRSQTGSVSRESNSKSIGSQTESVRRYPENSVKPTKSVTSQRKRTVAGQRQAKQIKEPLARTASIRDIIKKTKSEQRNEIKRLKAGLTPSSKERGELMRLKTKKWKTPIISFEQAIAESEIENKIAIAKAERKHLERQNEIMRLQEELACLT